MDSNLNIYEPLQLAGSPSIQILKGNNPFADVYGRVDDTTVVYENVSCDRTASVQSEETEGFEIELENESSMVFSYGESESFEETDENPCDCASVSMFSRLSQHSYKGGWARFGLDADPWDDEKQPAFKVLNYDELELTEEEKDGVLTDRVVYACSSFLDKNPESQRLTLAKLVAQDKYISDIKILEAHRYLQYIDLSHNNLRDIWPLSGVPYLMHLDVSHNELTEVLNFKAPWNLTYVDFSFNRVTTINDLSDFWSLVYLDLSNNRINKIEGLMNLRYLNYLNLSMNAITCFENLNNLYISVLDISRNMIRTFEEGPGVGMRTMINLSELDISCNNLSTLAIFKGVYHVKVCNMEENEVERLYEIDHMKTMRQLTNLNLSGNGMTRWPKYRPMVINTLRTLAVLDEVRVESQERVGATVQFDPDVHIKSACQFAKMQLLEEVDSPPSLGLDIMPVDQAPYPLIVLVGPDGSMKEHLIKWMVEKFPDKIHKCVNYTSRVQSKDEVDGEDYHFVSQQKFNEMSRSGTFLYIDELLGDSYGFSRFEIEKAVKQKKLCLVKMEILGALTLKAYGLEPTLVLTITENEELHFRRLTGKYRASLVLISRCSMASMGAVSLGRRDPTAASEEKIEDDQSDNVTIVTDMLNFGVTPSFVGSTTRTHSSNHSGDSEKISIPASVDGTTTTYEASELENFQPDPNSVMPSIPSLIDNMSWLNLPVSQRLSTVEDSLKKLTTSSNLHAMFSENSYKRPSRDIGIESSYARQSRDLGIDNGYMRQSRDVGFDNVYTRQSRDLGFDNALRQSRDVGFDNVHSRQSKDVGFDNVYTRQSRDVGFDNVYTRQSRDVGFDNIYMRQSRDLAVAASASNAHHQISKSEDSSLHSRSSKISRPIVQFQDTSVGNFNTELFYRSALDSVENINSISGVIDVVSNSNATAHRLLRQESSQSHVTMESSLASTASPYRGAETDTDEKLSFTKMNVAQPPFDSAATLLVSEEMYMKSIIRTRETYFQTHRDNPGTFAETIYTDDIDKAQRQFERFVKTVYTTRPSRYPVFNIEEDKSYQSMMAQRLEQFKQEIYNEQRTMSKQLDEMAKYRAPRVPPQRQPSLVDKEMQRWQKQPRKNACKLASF